VSAGQIVEQTLGRNTGPREDNGPAHNSRRGGDNASFEGRIHRDIIAQFDWGFVKHLQPFGRHLRALGSDLHAFGRQLQGFGSVLLCFGSR
jgi:hypothetical protein